MGLQCLFPGIIAALGVQCIRACRSGATVGMGLQYLMLFLRLCGEAEQLAWVFRAQECVCRLVLCPKRVSQDNAWATIVQHCAMSAGENA